MTEKSPRLCGRPLVLPAADNLWRESGNMLLAQQLLRHGSVATTQAYLHPTRDDLSDALAGLKLWRSGWLS